MPAEPSVPPRLTGPRMAVWAAFPFDERIVAPDGTKADWKWAISQWDRVAKAGPAVRLVVVDQSYSRLTAATPEVQSRRADVVSKLQACRAAEQLVYGRVYAGAGRLPLGQVGETFEDPLNPGRQVPGVATQIDAWRRLFGRRIDGIFLDAGPRDCTDPAVPGSDTTIPGNYARYVDAIRRKRLSVLVQALQQPDAQPGAPWLRNLGADFVQLWQKGVTLYRSSFHAIDPCDPDGDRTVPSWWDPGTDLRWSRVHVVDDCRDAATMAAVAQLAIDKRAAGTIWITQPRKDPDLGPVYDVLPPYWDEEVAFFRRFADEEQRLADEQLAKDAADTARDAAAKREKDAKDDKEAIEQKAEKDGKDSKDSKDEKDGKDEPDKPKEDPKEKNEDKEEKENKDGKDFKDEKDDKDGPPETILKDSEAFAKTLETVAGRPLPGAAPGARRWEPVAEQPRGRTFIRAGERPAVGERIVADPDDGEA